MLTNFELKRLKPKLDIVKKPENRVHELTDSNVSRLERRVVENTLGKRDQVTPRACARVRNTYGHGDGPLLLPLSVCHCTVNIASSHITITSNPPGYHLLIRKANLDKKKIYITKYRLTLAASVI